MNYLSTAAHIDPTGAYRYSLERRWAETGPTAVFIGLNPSTADASQDDPTIRREVGFARSWGCARLLKGNIFALRSTDPKALYGHADPVGPENNRTLLLLAAQADHLVACWGAHGELLARGADVRKLLAAYQLLAFGLTKAGHPKHPLYLRSDLRPAPFGGGR